MFQSFEHRHCYNNPPDSRSYRYDEGGDRQELDTNPEIDAPQEYFEEPDHPGASYHPAEDGKRQDLPQEPGAPTNQEVSHQGVQSSPDQEGSEAVAQVPPQIPSPAKSIVEEVMAQERINIKLAQLLEQGIAPTAQDLEQLATGQEALEARVERHYGRMSSLLQDPGTNSTRIIRLEILQEQLRRTLGETDIINKRLKG